MSQPADPPRDLDPPAQFPAIIPPGAVATPADPVALVPALIAAAGDAAGWGYLEFFTANIRKPHTRRAYSPLMRRASRLPRDAGHKGRCMQDLHAAFAGAAPDHAPGIDAVHGIGIELACAKR